MRLPFFLFYVSYSGLNFNYKKTYSSLKKIMTGNVIEFAISLILAGALSIVFDRFGGDIRMSIIRQFDGDLYLVLN